MARMYERAPLGAPPMVNLISVPVETTFVSETFVLIVMSYGNAISVSPKETPVPDQENIRSCSGEIRFTVHASAHGPYSKKRERLNARCYCTSSLPSFHFQWKID